MIVEYVRNVLGFRDADHEESNPVASRLVVTALSCSINGVSELVTLAPGSTSAALYGRPDALEDYRCNYGLNSDYAALLERNGMRVSGSGPDGEARIVELRDHPFYLATLFLPQLRSSGAAPHPLIRGFVSAAGA